MNEEKNTEKTEPLHGYLLEKMDELNEKCDILNNIRKKKEHIYFGTLWEEDNDEDSSYGNFNNDMNKYINSINNIIDQTINFINKL